MDKEKRDNVSRVATSLALTATILSLVHDTRMHARKSGAKTPSIDKDLGAVIDQMHGSVESALRIAESDDFDLTEGDRKVFKEMPAEEEVLGAAEVETKRCTAALKAREAYMPLPESLVLVRRTLVCFCEMGASPETRELAAAKGLNASLLNEAQARIMRVIGMVDDFAAGRPPSGLRGAGKGRKWRARMRRERGQTTQGKKEA